MTDDDFVRLFQVRAKQHGFFSGFVGGNAGPLTLAALDKVLPTLGPETGALPAWIMVGMEALGWNEARDRDRLSAFLRRDGATLGDPAALPWCGDFTQTCIRMALPTEPFPGALGENPYWALNWQFLGMRLAEPMQGCIAYKARDGGGHVTFPIGRDATGATLFCLGGNQSNEVSVAAYPRAGFLGFRWPKTAPAPLPLPLMDGAHLPRSGSEA